MLKRSSRKRDIDALAGSGREASKVIIDGKNPAAVALGRLGGLRGGRARAEKLTCAQRSEIAKKAAQRRWHGE